MFSPQCMLLCALLLVQVSPSALTDRGIVSGRIISMNGGPAQGVRVAATAAADPSNQVAGTTILVSIAQTDDQGRYVLENVPPGRYTITAGQLDIPTYYPGVLRESSAAVINVTPRSTTTGIDFGLSVPAMAWVRGRVVLPPGASMTSGVKIRLFGTASLSNTASGAVSALSALTGATLIFSALVTEMPTADIADDGSFEIRGVRPGNYAIAFSSLPFRFFGPPSVLIVEENVDLEIRVPATGKIEGNSVLESEDTGPLPRFAFQFSGAYNGTGTIGSNGGFQTELPEGDYTLTPTGLPAGYSIKSLRSGTTDLLTKPLQLKAGESPLQIAAVLAVTSSMVGGRVTGIDPSVGGVTGVVLTGGPTKISTEITLKENGAFTFPNVLPGVYELTIAGTASDPASYFSRPRSVTVTDRDVADIEIRAGRLRTLRGQLTLEAGEQIGAPFPILVLSLEGDSGLTTIPVKPASDGSFALALPEGDWRAEIHGLPSGYSPRTLSYGGIDLLKDTLKIFSTPQSDLRMTLAVAPDTLSRVKGRVTGLDSAENAKIILQGVVIASDIQASVLPDGSFEFPGVPESQYTVSLAGSTAAAAPFFTVAGVDTSGVVLNVPRKIPGRVVVDGSNVPMPPLTMTATIEVHTIDKQRVYAGTIDSGPFGLSLNEGDHTISVRDLPEGFQLRSLTYGSRNLLLEPLVVRGAPTSEIIVTIAAPVNGR